jgi:hypothetical protein
LPVGDRGPVHRGGHKTQRPYGWDVPLHGDIARKGGT